MTWVLITGCSSGIGYASAQLLHARGYRVVASARRLQDVERLRREGLMAVQLDLDDDASIRQGLADALTLSQGRLDVLFNNAGFGQAGAIEDRSRAHWVGQFQTNVFGTLELTRQALAIMRAQNAGRILFNSSVLGYVALPYRGLYNASKFALEGAVDTLRLELRDTPIELALLEPGPIATRFRVNSLHSLEDLDPEQSFHRAAYPAIRQRLQAERGSRHSLSANAVAERVWRLLQSRRLPARTPITRPAWLFYYLKRLLPVRWLDALLSRGN